MKPLNIVSQTLRWEVLIGTGGVGSGIFMLLDGNQTLGREESRGSRLLDQRDYCKLHIISHYVKMLLGPDFQVLPVSKVGADETGQRLSREMESAGLDTSIIRVDESRPSMYSVCFLYPDGSGCNLTTTNSACGQMEADEIRTAIPAFARHAGRGIALAAPEVPLAARAELLRLATEYHFFRVASFTAHEMVEALEIGLLGQVDLLAINLDEATALAGQTCTGSLPQSIAEAAHNKLLTLNPDMLVTITAGQHGSWAWDGLRHQFCPALPVTAISTAGAGDAFLAGLLCGLASGLDLFEAQSLGTLAAACSVTSPHTIHPTLDREALAQIAIETHMPLREKVTDLLGR